VTPHRVQVLIGLGVAAAVLLAVVVTGWVLGWEDEAAAPTSQPTST